MDMPPELVFDVGMNNGDDTAYYLFRGLNVVAVEADPTLCMAARQRFAAAVSNGRLIIENVGIAAQEGELQFWVSDWSVWSSFSRENATKGNAHATPIAVRTIRFSQLLEQHGTPCFLKIDIEGNDRMCLQDLSDFERPPFLSIEMSYDDGGIDIDLLSELGYRAFKCIRQNDFFQMRSENIRWQRSVRKVLSHVGPAGEPLRRLGHRRLRVQGWRFPFGSSGPLPQDLAGPWISHEEVLSVWRQLQNLDLELGANGLGEWFDIHAKL
jgi:FkbM family methyltransferase